MAAILAQGCANKHVKKILARKNSHDPCFSRAVGRGVWGFFLRPPDSVGAARKTNGLEETSFK
jgi:hypothetical protein